MKFQETNRPSAHYAEWWVGVARDTCVGSFGYTSLGAVTDKFVERRRRQSQAVQRTVTELYQSYSARFVEYTTQTTSVQNTRSSGRVSHMCAQHNKREPVKQRDTPTRPYHRRRRADIPGRVRETKHNYSYFFVVLLLFSGWFESCTKGKFVFLLNKKKNFFHYIQKLHTRVYILFLVMRI